MRATEKVFAIVAAFAAVNVSAQVASPNNEQDRMAIERLHQEDITATSSDDADQLARLWDEEAVRLQSGAPAEAGKAKIYANDKRWQANSSSKRCCEP